MSYNQLFNYRISTDITFGKGVIEKIPNIVKKYSKNVLLVTMMDIPSVKQLETILSDNDINLSIFSDVHPNPYSDEADKAAQLGIKNNCGAVIGFGGGSVIDVAKAAALVMSNGGSAWNYSSGKTNTNLRKITKEAIPIIAIPTTAGTSSEISNNSVLTNRDTQEKSGIFAPEIFPKHAVIDYELTATMPKRITASTGFDAFTHSFECFLVNKPFPYIDNMSRDTMKLVYDNLETVIANPDNLDGRAALSWACVQSFLARTADVGETGLHVTSLPISAIFDVSHGEALAIVMPAVLKRLIDIYPSKAADLLPVFLNDLNPMHNLTIQQKCNEVQKLMAKWLADIEMTRTLSNYGIKEENINSLIDVMNFDRIEKAWGRSVTQEDIFQLYMEVL